MSKHLRAKEVNEAIRAGKNALKSLYRARKLLKKARFWGWIDIFGGSLFSGLFKHSRMHRAKKCMEDARRDLIEFKHELRDLRDPGLTAHCGDFLTFADFFFDGFIADVLVQSRIHDARKQVDEAIRRTKDLLKRLEKYN